VVNAPTNINNQQASVNAIGAGGYGGGYGGYGGYGGRFGGGYGWHTPFRDYYGGWYRGNWGWYAGGAALTGAALGWLGGVSSDYSYSNPFYSEPAEDVPVALNYAQPIVIQAPPAEAAPVEVNVTVSEDSDATPSLTPPPKPEPAEEAPKEDPVVKEAMALMDKARSAFLTGDYPRAQELIEKGIKKLPGDATLHEFRALTLFAQKKYSEAAGTIYAVLSAGPGWTWDTLKSFYDNEKTYQEQLRALEKDSRANPKSADDHFLLGYHYLILDAKDAATKQLEKVAKLLPKDELTAALLKALKAPPPTDRPKPEE
jgi:TolA-binding protein